MAKKNNLPDDLFEEGDNRADIIIDSSNVPVKRNNGIEITPEKIQMHLKTGGSFELIPLGCKAIVVRQEFNPAIQGVVSDLTHELGQIGGITTQDDAAKANATLKRAKQLIKTLSEERKFMTAVLDEEKKRIMGYEEKIISDLEKLVKIINGSIELFQAEEFKKQQELERKLREKRDEELRLAQIETDRKTKIQEMIMAFENSVLKGSAAATIDTIDEQITRLKSMKINKDKYMEFLPQAEIMYQQCVTRMNERKVELMKLADAEKKGKAAVLKLKMEQDVKTALDLKNQQQKSENILANLEEEKQSDIANSQMNYELQVSQGQEIKGVQKKRKADFETINMALLPEEFKTFDEKKIKEAIAAGCESIPGVEIKIEITNVSR